MNIIAGYGWNVFAHRFPKMAARIMFRHIVGRWPNINYPKDLNEKINYLKFHEDMYVWARLADKYAVRDYVKERGLESILVPFYGKFDTPEDLIASWDSLPNQFVVKSNHSSGTIAIIEDKNKTDINKLKRLMRNWLDTKMGVGSVEPHYEFIKPCLLIEKYLEDDSVKGISHSLIDYKIWCFEGKPYCILVTFDRHVGANDHHLFLETYDLNWNRVPHAMTDKVMKSSIDLEKPNNLDALIETASILSKGHKQVRVDLYDIEGKIYFGEMTFTSQGGYMDYFTPAFLEEMGQQFEVS